MGVGSGPSGGYEQQPSYGGAKKGKWSPKKKVKASKKSRPPKKP